MVLKSPTFMTFGLTLAVAVIVALWFGLAKASPTITVWKNPDCECCNGWVEHLRAANFKVKIIEQVDLAPIHAERGISDAVSSCHTALIDGYVIEGHVPAADIRRLLSEHPDARGLSAPGMPVGAPGMETSNGDREPYDVLLLLRDGSTRVFMHHS